MFSPTWTCYSLNLCHLQHEDHSWPHTGCCNPSPPTTASLILSDDMTPWSIIKNNGVWIHLIHECTKSQLRDFGTALNENNNSGWSKRRCIYLFVIYNTILNSSCTIPLSEPDILAKVHGAQIKIKEDRTTDESSLMNCISLFCLPLPAVPYGHRSLLSLKSVCSEGSIPSFHIKLKCAH